MRHDSPANPYRNLPERNFWMRTVAKHNAMDLGDWYTKKFSIDGMRIATAGSCFAQHLGRQLRRNRFNVVDTEPAPGFLAPARHAEFGYGLYSARYGNVYTSRQLLQLFQRAAGDFTPEEHAWPMRNGFVDPFRPTIEPEPFASIEELEASRAHHLSCVRRVLREADLFVFTLGLTETWMAMRDEAVFPVAPGVSGGVYDEDRYSLLNLSFTDVLADMKAFIRLARDANPQMHFLLTVSPVPLMATACDQHVVAASTYSKSILRAVAGQLASQYRYVDYFPSYEIVSSHIFRGQFYNADLRTVASYGVDHVMKQFFAQHIPAPRAAHAHADALRVQKHPDDVMCDEELLNAFGKSP